MILAQVEDLCLAQYPSRSRSSHQRAFKTPSILRQGEYIIGAENNIFPCRDTKREVIGTISSVLSSEQYSNVLHSYSRE